MEPPVSGLQREAVRLCLIDTELDSKRGLRLPIAHRRLIAIALDRTDHQSIVCTVLKIRGQSGVLTTAWRERCRRVAFTPKDGRARLVGDRIERSQYEPSLN